MDLTASIFGQHPLKTKYFMGTFHCILLYGGIISASDVDGHSLILLIVYLLFTNNLYIFMRNESANQM